jgi:4-amino-4-deoxy-L-arabinose transferase-like glycosyltransferase
MGGLMLWLLATVWMRPLMLPDEGRYGEVARSMLMNSNSWQELLVPTLNGLPFFHKPPLFYWLDMVAMSLFGSHEFVTRVGSVVGAWLMGAALLLGMRRWHGLRLGRIGLGVLATTPFFFCGSQYANHDMLVGGLITAAIFAMVRAQDDDTLSKTATEKATVHLGWLVTGWAMCALALLSKGLIGVVLPMLVVGPWLLALGRWRQLFKLLHPLGLLAFAAVAAPWFIAMQLRFPDFLDYFFVEQHFRRFAQSHFNNVRGIWFFFAVLPVLTLPWVAWLLQALPRFKWRSVNLHTFKLNPVVGLYIWWTVVVVGFFSIPSSKLIGYALPALAPWCALLTLLIGQQRAKKAPTSIHQPREIWPWVMGGSAVLCVGIVIALAIYAPKSSRLLSLALAANMAATDKVVMVDAYVYDVPFYAQLKHPVIIASNWGDPDVPRRDNWRKEIFDAARLFNPTLGAQVLQPLTGLNTFACNASAVWFIVPVVNASSVAGLTGTVRVFTDERHELWRTPGRSCS